MTTRTDAHTCHAEGCDTKAEMLRSYSAVRFGPDGSRKGWCSHKHRYTDTADACARQLNRSWPGTGDTWKVEVDGHLRVMETPRAGADVD